MVRSMNSSILEFLFAIFSLIAIHECEGEIVLGLIEKDTFMTIDRSFFFLKH